LTKSSGWKFYLKTLINHDERQLLIDFNEVVLNSKATCMCAHNGKEFDYPFITRRQIINKVSILPMLNTIGKKPWDIIEKLLDTMVMWSGVQFNYKVTLSLLAHVLGLPSPKTIMDGSEVNGMYWSILENEKEVFDNISLYNQGDVITLANVYLSLT